MTENSFHAPYLVFISTQKVFNLSIENFDPISSMIVTDNDPNTDTATTFGTLTGTSKWENGAIASDGKIYSAPFGPTTVLVNNHNILTSFGSLAGGGKWLGLNLALNGKIYGIQRELLDLILAEMDRQELFILVNGAITVFWYIKRKGITMKNGYSIKNEKLRIENCATDNNLILLLRKILKFFILHCNNFPV